MTRPPFAPGSTLAIQDVADLIDHALLKPELTPDEVVASIRELAAHRIWSVCVRPSDVALATATIAEVARRARVSKTTVSRVLNNKSDVDAATDE